jgi:hypothetical protein
MRGDGVSVRFLRSVYVPEDETCFFLLEGESALAVAETARRAGLAFTRVEDTIAVPAGTQQQAEEEK